MRSLTTLTSSAPSFQNDSSLNFETPLPRSLSCDPAACLRLRHISATIPPAPPPLLVDADRPHLRLFDVDTVTPRTYPVIREFATGKSIPPPFLDWIRSFVDADFTDEEWGDSYMMPVEGQPKYYHCVDLLHYPQRASDWDTIWRAMNDDGENVE